MADPYRAVVRRRGDWLVASVLGLAGVSAVAENVGNLSIALRSELAKYLKLPLRAEMPEILLVDTAGKPVFEDEAARH